MAYGSSMRMVIDPPQQTGSAALISLTGSYTGSLSDDGFGTWGLVDVENNTWSFAQSTGDLTLTVVPEPSGVLLALLGSLALLRRRR